MTGKSQAALIHAFALCRTKAEQRVMYCVGTHEGRVRSLELARFYLDEGEFINKFNDNIYFPNGSQIIIYKPESVTGTVVHEVIFDGDADHLSEAMIEHIKTRARLK